jgi:hypothetical protein
MKKRLLIVVPTLALVACNPAASPSGATPTNAASPVDAASPDTELPDAAELLANEPLPGSWEQVSDASITGARFTSTGFPAEVTIGCDAGDNSAYINWGRLADPAVAGDIRIYTAAKTETFAATAMNDGDHLLAVSLPGNDPRLAVLRARQERFAVQGSGQSVVLRWDPLIAETLSECAS